MKISCCALPSVSFEKTRQEGNTDGTDAALKVWSQMLGCVSLAGIFRETEIETRETDDVFMFLLTVFPN